MEPSPRTVLAGRAPGPRLEWVAVPLATFLLVFGAYASGVFDIAGGVVFVPGEAGLVALALAVGLALLGRGLALAWLTAYAALLGYAADHYLLGLGGRPLGERVVALLGLDGLVAQAVLAALLAGVAWTATRIAVRAVDAVRGTGRLPGRH